MLAKSDRVFRRKKQCPECGGTVSDAFIEQNPFPEFPCPSCNALIAVSALRDVVIDSENERSAERVPASLQVSYESYNEFITEYTRDVSRGGIFINTRRHHTINEMVELYLAVPGLEKPLLIKGEVVHIKLQNVPDEEAGIGVKFIDIDSGSRKTLIDFMKSRKDL